MIPYGGNLPPGWTIGPNGIPIPPSGQGMGYPAQGMVPPSALGTPPNAALGGIAAMNNGLPRMTGPQIFGPTNRPINPSQQVGPFRNPFTDAQTLDTSQMGGGEFNWTNLLKGGSPTWRTILAAAGVMQPTPAETGELPWKYWPPTNTAPGTMQWPGSTSYPQAQPGNPLPSPGLGQGPFAGRPSAAQPPAASIGQGPFANRPSAPVAVSPKVAAPPPAPPRINLGYYTGSMGGPGGSAAGGARNPQFIPYPNPNDPRIYQGA